MHMAVTTLHHSREKKNRLRKSLKESLKKVFKTFHVRRQIRSVGT